MRILFRGTTFLVMLWFIVACGTVARQSANQTEGVETTVTILATNGPPVVATLHVRAAEDPGRLVGLQVAHVRHLQIRGDLLLQTAVSPSRYTVQPFDRCPSC